MPTNESDPSTHGSHLSSPPAVRIVRCFARIPQRVLPPTVSPRSTACASTTWKNVPLQPATPNTWNAHGTPQCTVTIVRRHNEGSSDGTSEAASYHITALHVVGTNGIDSESVVGLCMPSCCANGPASQGDPPQPEVCEQLQRALPLLQDALFGGMGAPLSVYCPEGLLVLRPLSLSASEDNCATLDVGLLVVAPRRIVPTDAPIVVCRAVGLGSDCTTASALRAASLCGPSQPFDWLRSNPWALRCVLQRLRGCPEATNPHWGPFDTVVSVSHVQGTNAYHRNDDAALLGSSSDVHPLVLDVSCGLIATQEEAHKMQRRMPRLAWCLRPQQPFVEAPPVLFVHVGQSAAAAQMYAVVDGCLLPDGASGGGSAALDAMIDVASTMLRGSGRPGVLLCLNVVAESLVLLASHRLVVVHCAIGHGTSWEHTAANIGSMLQRLFVLEGGGGSEVR